MITVAMIIPMRMARFTEFHVEKSGHQGAGQCTGAWKRDAFKKNQAPESEFLNLSLVFIGFLPDPDSKLSKSGNAFHDIQDFFNEQQDEWNREQVSDHTDGNGPQDRNI